MSLARAAALLLLFVSVARTAAAETGARCPYPALTVTAIPGVRDPRARPPRAIPLLNAELQGLENLARVTSPTSPDLVPLERRLAEDYEELADASLASGRQAAARARSHAEAYYEKLLASAPSYGQIDEVEYYLGLAYERDGDLGKARRLYFTLIQQQPQSRLVPLAYLAFADLFFDEAQGDPSKWELAAQAYQKVIGYPPLQNPAYGYAWYRLAHVKWNQGDGVAARRAFTKASEYASAFGGQPGTTEIAAGVASDSAALRRACPTVAP